tara:strand:- start:822 stop:1088 length:267 start_codon:yes stop_codon:yes gene_type:complete
MQMRNWLREDPRYWYITGYEKATAFELAEVYVNSMEQGLDVSDLINELNNRNLSLNELETIYLSHVDCTCRLDGDDWSCPVHGESNFY